ncbi:Armadillo-like helical, partial [Corchorus capsularis]
MAKISCSAADVKPLIKLAKTSLIGAAETVVAALANLLSDSHIVAEALAEDVVSALKRVLGDGTSEGKKNASRALHQLLKHFPVGDVLIGNSQCRFTVLALVDSLNTMDMDTTNVADALEVVALLSRTKKGVNLTYPPWSALAEAPSSLEPLVQCLAEGPPPLQDKSIEILSRLCGEQPVVLSDLLIASSKSIGSLANKIINSVSVEVRVGGAALLMCTAKEHKQQSVDALDQSGYLKPLIEALVDMAKRNTRCTSLEIEVRAPRDFIERTAFQEGEVFDIPDPATVLGGIVALCLLSILSSCLSKNRITVMEAGGLEVLPNKLASYVSNPQ